MKEVKTGLVLEGGAMRGMYTAGILDVLMEEKIQVDGVIRRELYLAVTISLDR